MEDTIFQILWKKNIIQTSKNKIIQDVIDQDLEHSGGTGETKWHN